MNCFAGLADRPQFINLAVRAVAHSRKSRASAGHRPAARCSMIRSHVEQVVEFRTQRADERSLQIRRDRPECGDDRDGLPEARPRLSAPPCPSPFARSALEVPDFDDVSELAAALGGPKRQLFDGVNTIADRASESGGRSSHERSSRRLPIDVTVPVELVPRASRPVRLSEPSAISRCAGVVGSTEQTHRRAGDTQWTAHARGSAFCVERRWWTSAPAAGNRGHADRARSPPDLTCRVVRARRAGRFRANVQASTRVIADLRRRSAATWRLAALRSRATSGRQRRPPALLAGSGTGGSSTKACRPSEPITQWR